MSYRQDSVNREPPAACSDRIGAVPCSQPRAAPRILSSACVRPSVHVQNALPLSLCPVPAISARFPRPHDAPRLPTSFPQLSPSPSGIPSFSRSLFGQFGQHIAVNGVLDECRLILSESEVS